MAPLANIIRAHATEILQAWTVEAQKTASARGLDRPEFQNIINTYLLSLADADTALGRFEGARREHVETHLSSRLRQGFSLAEIVEEFALLGRCIAATWASGRNVEPPERIEVERLFEELHLTSAAVADLFTRHMMEDEQAEKQFVRLIQDVANDALKVKAPPLAQRLKEVLNLVMEALAAQAAAIVLYEPATEHLELKATVGAGNGALQRFVMSPENPLAAPQVTPEVVPTALPDVEVTQLEVGEGLRRSGIGSLLAVRLPSRQQLLGVLYVGMAATRRFTAREIRRAEALGQHLAVHLDNARLYADLRDRIGELSAERELRERFVSLLAHDLRGPLSAAKMSGERLIKHPEQRELAQRVVQNIDRTDRMIRDLLDANRIRAGERLPLNIEQLELAVLAREVHHDLVSSYGERFVLNAEPGVQGYWSADELRRAVWNLAANAVKYGAADRPVTLTVRRRGNDAEVSVHNWGEAIPLGDQRALFRPFSRTRAAQRGSQRGWGLGLTLVQGAVDAHGGSVRVESTPLEGTTFTLELPLDARPFAV